MRLTLEQFRALTGVGKKEKKPVAIAGGYRSRWRGTETIGGKTCNFRSLWEYNYACYLQFLKSNGKIHDWLFEPQNFQFPMIYKTTPFGYLPDFKVYITPTKYEWHETKGWLSPRSKKKIKRFHKHYPQEGQIVLIGADWFKKNTPTLSRLVPGWKKLS